MNIMNNYKHLHNYVNTPIIINQIKSRKLSQTDAPIATLPHEKLTFYDKYFLPFKSNFTTQVCISKNILTVLLFSLHINRIENILYIFLSVL